MILMHLKTLLGITILKKYRIFLIRKKPWGLNLGGLQEGRRALEVEERALEQQQEALKKEIDAFSKRKKSI